MNKIKVFSTIVFSVLGIFGAKEHYKPRNIKDLLKWKGIKLSSDDKVWKSMFFENQKELENMKITDFNSLWNWCNEKFKNNNLSEENFNEAKKYCSDNPKTIMGRIIREGEDHKLIKKENSDSYKINYLLATSKKEVLELINAYEPITPSGVAEKYAKWCENNKRIKIINSSDKEKFANFKKRCYELGVKTFSSLLKKQGLTTMSKAQQFQNKFNGKLEYAKEFGQEIKTSFESRKDEFIILMNSSEEMRKKYQNSAWKDEDLFKEYGWVVYKSWCDKKLNESLLDETGEKIKLDDYQKFSYRCSAEKEIS